MTETPAPNPREFNTTHWTLVGVAQADDASHTAAREALDALCRAYWYPLYAFVRSRGHDAFEAQDLTQSFLAQFIRQEGFATADRARGRFRSYLLGAMKHFLANEWHRGHRLKRGGDVACLEWDALEPEARYALEAPRAENPETAYDREWARELTDRAIARLREEFTAAGKGALFETLKPSLTGSEPPRAETAAQLGLSEGAVKVAVHRLRQRYRELVRQEVAETVNHPSEIDEEMRHLVGVLREK